MIRTYTFTGKIQIRKLQGCGEPDVKSVIYLVGVLAVSKSKISGGKLLVFFLLPAGNVIRMLRFTKNTVLLVTNISENKGRL